MTADELLSIAVEIAACLEKGHTPALPPERAGKLANWLHRIGTVMAMNDAQMMVLLGRGLAERPISLCNRLRAILSGEAMQP